MFLSFGQVAGQDAIGLRFYMAGYQASGYTGNLRVGIDANGDGAVDLFFGPSLTGATRTQGIVFQLPTGPGNYSPSTTNLGNNFGRIAFTNDNYNYMALTNTIDPNWTNVGANQNSVISFAVPVATLQSLLAQSGITLTPQTYISFLAFTSTQSNAINQDLIGSNGIVADARFDGVDGGFGDYYTSSGTYKKRPIIPEPSTYGAMFILISGGLLYMLRRKK